VMRAVVVGRSEDLLAGFEWQAVITRASPMVVLPVRAISSGRPPAYSAAASLTLCGRLSASGPHKPRSTTRNGFSSSARRYF
jgi:hypothetical protein